MPRHRSSEKGRLTLLMIEDDQGFIDDFVDMSRRNIRPIPIVHYANSVPDAISKLDNAEFLDDLDVIVIDLKLSGGETGLRFLEEFRSRHPGSGVTMIALTDLDSRSIIIGGRQYELVELYNRGISRIISKSVVFRSGIEEVYRQITSKSDNISDKNPRVDTSSVNRSGGHRAKSNSAEAIGQPNRASGHLPGPELSGERGLSFWLAVIRNMSPIGGLCVAGIAVGTIVIGISKTLNDYQQAMLSYSGVVLIVGSTLALLVCVVIALIKDHRA